VVAARRREARAIAACRSLVSTTAGRFDGNTVKKSRESSRKEVLLRRSESHDPGMREPVGAGDLRSAGPGNEERCIVEQRRAKRAGHKKQSLCSSSVTFVLDVAIREFQRTKKKTVSKLHFQPQRHRLSTGFKRGFDCICPKRNRTRAGWSRFPSPFITIGQVPRSWAARSVRSTPVSSNQINLRTCGDFGGACARAHTCTPFHWFIFAAQPMDGRFDVGR